ncbi:hypothetical protein ACEQ8H_007945 [Pleosporales sp. CAS-2024a]
MSRTGTPSSLPATMRAWQWSQCNDTLENAIRLQDSAPLPTARRPLRSGESLVQVYAAALNPVDYKLAELPIAGRIAITKPATPGLDFAGSVVEVGPDCQVHVGQRVFGKLEPNQQFGSLGEYVVVSKAGVVPIPEGVSVEHAATLGICGLVSYQSLAPNVKPGDRLFINGGSGGTGTFAVQIAKALGCHVTTTCSGSNVPLCKDLGADEVIDYRSSDVLKTLAQSPQKYDFVLDNIGNDYNMYWKAPEFTRPGAKYVQIGSEVSFSVVYEVAFRLLLPSILGGGKRPFAFGMTTANPEHLTELGALLVQGKVRPVIDEIFAFEDAPDAYKKLKTGRAKGKIVVRVRHDETST